MATVKKRRPEISAKRPDLRKPSNLGTFIRTPIVDPPGLLTRSGQPMPPGHSIEFVPPAGMTASFDAISGDAVAREAFAKLGELAGEDDGALVASELARLFDGIARVLSANAAIPGGVAGISRDSAREYSVLTRRVLRVLGETKTIEKRRRTYLENRIIRAAGHCSMKSGAQDFEAAAQQVVSLCHDDAFSRPLAGLLVEQEVALTACIRAASALEPVDGRFPSPGTRNHNARDQYNKAFDLLCRGLKLAVASPDARKAERSRMRR